MTEIRVVAYAGLRQERCSLARLIKRMTLMRFFVSTTFAKDQTPIKEVISACEASGIFCLELGSNHPYEKNPLAAIGNSSTFVYLVHNYFPAPKEDFVVNIASTDPVIWKRSLEHVFRSLDFCHALNAKLYTLHPGFVTDPIGPSANVTNYDFKFQNKALSNRHCQQALRQMHKSLPIIIDYAQKKQVRIAIESMGSRARANHLIMHCPEEFFNFTHRYSKEEIGINLNLAHARLASLHFNFSLERFVQSIQTRIVAMELSHTNDLKDDHLPLREGAWYWSIICKPELSHVYKILEFRNTPIEMVQKVLELTKKTTLSFSGRNRPL